MLEHHPLTREDFDDVARDERVRRELPDRVCNTIADAGLDQDNEQRVLLQLQAHWATAQAPDVKD